MRKFYRKSEIWFAVMWIVVYVAGMSAADIVSEKLGLVKSVTFAFALVLSAVLYFWIKKSGLTEKYGLVKPKLRAKYFGYYIPLIVLSSCNFWLGVKMNLPVPEALLYAGSMLLVGFLEEVIFRGLLFRALEKDNVQTAILVSALTFGLGHFVNLLNGAEADLMRNICQVAYAVAFGYMFVIIFYYGKSLLPCIFAHSAMNVLSVIGNSGTPMQSIAISVILILGAGGYAMLLLKKLPFAEEE